MPDFSDGFMQFVPPDPTKIRGGIVGGLIVLDSNVLLSAYRFAPESRQELLEVLATIGDRLWIPHQVALEFHRNRLKVIADYDAAYRSALDVLAQRQKEVIPELDRKIRELSNRVALSKNERDGLLRLLSSSFEGLGESLDKLRRGHGVDSLGHPDSIFERLAQIFVGKVGEELSPEDHEVEVAEALRRVQYEIPPGYKDADKNEPHGDYFVWCQSIREASVRKAKELVLVTNDVKEDWYFRLKGQAVMARPELVLECFEKSGAHLILLPTRQFLAYAKEFLEADVSDETIRQAEQAQLQDLRALVTESIAEESMHATQITNLLNERARCQAESDRAGFELAKVEDEARRLQNSALDNENRGAELEDLHRIGVEIGGRKAECEMLRNRLQSFDSRIELIQRALFDAREFRKFAIQELEEIGDGRAGT